MGYFVPFPGGECGILNFDFLLFDWSYVDSRNRIRSMKLKDKYNSNY